MRTLVQAAPSWNPVTQFQILNPSFSPTEGGKAFIVVDGVTYTWDGANDQGQDVASGTYYVQMKVTDPYGNVTTSTEAATVIETGKIYEVRIFNSAGELVKTLVVPTAYGAVAPSQVVPAATVFTPDPLGKGAGLKFDLGGGLPALTWDGTNNQGQLVQSGSYTVQLLADGSNGSTTLADSQVTVVERGGDLLSGLLAAPDPAVWGQAAFVEIRFQAPAGTQVTGRVYDMAGELVANLDNGANPEELVLPLNGKGLAGGVYVVAVTARAPWGTVERRILKFALVR